MPDNIDLLEAGLAALRDGCSLIPIDSRTKRPAFDLLPQACTIPRATKDGQLLNSRGRQVPPDGTDPGKGIWANAMHWPANETEVRAWVRAGAQLAIVAGPVSHGVECLDFDVVESVGACLYGAWREAAGELADGLVLQRTGGGGYQVVYRVDGLTDGNLKLAYLPDEAARSGESTAIETRGVGGYFVIAPSVHPSGRRYTLLRADWACIPTISRERRDALHAAARALDESVAERKAREAPAHVWTGVRLPGGDGVIDAFNEARTITGELEAAGYEQAGLRYYLPGNGDKERAGVVILQNRSYHHDSDDPLSDEHAHSPFDIFAHFTHDGDVAAAVKAAAEALDLEYAPFGPPLADAEGHACCPTHGTRLRDGKASGQYCPSPDPAGPRGWCGFWWRPGKDSAPLQRMTPAPGAPSDDTTPAAPGSYHRTDLGNARRLVDRHGAHLRYVHAWERWLVWAGGRWEMDETGAVHRLARETVASIYSELAAIADSDQRKDLAKWAFGSESRQRLTSMVALAQAEAGIPIRHEELNADGYLLGCANGTIDLRTGALLPASPEHLITKQSPVAYDPAATCPLWLSFLDTVLGSDAELISFLQRAIGMTLTADVREQVLLFLYGRGSNGKSTFIELLMALLGEYAMKAPTEMLMAKPQGGGIPNDVAKLPGVRMVATAETEEGRRLNESLVKDLTGGDTMSARFMRGEWFEFKPTHTIWMYGNHKPVIRGTDTGIWRRMRLVPFTVTIAEEDKDEELPAKLRAELPGILRWAVEGCLAWQAEGLGTPDAVRAATDSYRQEMDVLGSFLDESCVIKPTARAGATELYSAYKVWAERSGETVRSQTAFGRYLTERGFPAVDNSTGRKDRVGIGLRVVEDRHAPLLNGHPTYTTGEPDSSPDSTDGSDSLPISPHGEKASVAYIGELSKLSVLSENTESGERAPTTNGHHPATPDLSQGLWSAYDRQQVELALAALKAGRRDKARQYLGKVRAKAAREWLEQQLQEGSADG